MAHGQSRERKRCSKDKNQKYLANTEIPRYPISKDFLLKTGPHLAGRGIFTQITRTDKMIIMIHEMTIEESEKIGVHGLGGMAGC